jgi:hypothetical protein
MWIKFTEALAKLFYVVGVMTCSVMIVVVACLIAMWIISRWQDKEHDEFLRKHPDFPRQAEETQKAMEEFKKDAKSNAQ